MGCVKGIIKKKYFPNSLTIRRRWIQNLCGTDFGPKVGMYRSIYMILHAAQ